MALLMQRNCCSVFSVSDLEVVGQVLKYVSCKFLYLDAKIFEGRTVNVGTRVHGRQNCTWIFACKYINLFEEVLYWKLTKLIL